MMGMPMMGSTMMPMMAGTTGSTRGMMRMDMCEKENVYMMMMDMPGEALLLEFPHFSSAALELQPKSNEGSC